MEFREFGRIVSGNRGSNCEFTPEARAAAVSGRASGRTLKEVAEAIGTRRVATVTDIVKNFNTRKTTRTAFRKGRPRILNQRAEHRLVIIARRNPRATWQHIKQEACTRASISTIKRICKNHGLRKWRAARRIELTAETAKERLEFCRKYNSTRGIQALLNMLYSDEATVRNEPDSPGVWVIRYSGERYRNDLVNPQSHGRPAISIMLWAMIWQRNGEGGRSPLLFPQGDPDARKGGVSAKSYRDVLEEGLLPLYEPGDVFMQDNARIHNYGGTPEWLAQHGIEFIKWPVHSPDLNPIEHVWNAFKVKIRQIEPQFTSLKKNEADEAWAKQVLEAAWAELDDEFIAGLIKSMRHRIKAVIRAKGWYTQY